MSNLDIIKSFDAIEMGKFLASISSQKWYDWTENRDWLLQEPPEDGLLHKGDMIWKNQEWIFDKEKRNKVFFDNWIIAHIPDILEFLLTQGDITSYNVQVVIPTIEYGHKFDDYRDSINYKGTNFIIWSDFFDYKQEDIIGSHEGEEDYKKYLATYKIVNFMKNYEDLVSTIKIYYKNK